MIDAMEDEAMAATAPAPSRPPSISSQGVPLVLQISSLPRSSDQDEFFYNPYASLESGNFAAARAFFIHHAHVVVYHDCSDAMAFQDLYPSAIIGYISLIPEGLLAEGRCILESQQRALLCASALQAMVPMQPSPHVTPPQSLLDCHVVECFMRLSSNPPSTLAPSSSGNNPSIAGSAPPVGYHGGRLPSSSSARHSNPASSPSSNFHHGGGPTHQITPPLNGGPLWWTSPCLGLQPRLAHPIALPAPILLPPGLTLASFVLPLQVMTTDHPQLLHHTAITKDALTLLLGNPTRMALTTFATVIMGDFAWQKEGLFFALGGLDCISDQDFILLAIVLLTAMGSFMGGLPFIIMMSPPSSSHAMVFWLLLT